MFNFLKKNKQGTEMVLKIKGMHCVSCALTIDDALEELSGVVEAKTNYAKSETKLVVSEKVDASLIKKTIAELGYLAE